MHSRYRVMQLLKSRSREFAYSVVNAEAIQFLGEKYAEARGSMFKSEMVGAEK